jgi:flagellar biosynthetic protein FliP
VATALLPVWVVGIAPAALAQAPGLRIELGTGDARTWTTATQIVLLLTVLSLAPAVLVMMTAFTRIVVVLAFVRNALGTVQLPPNPVLVGLALFLTAFVMAPVWQQAYQQAYLPLQRGEIPPAEALERGLAPVREFMFAHTRPADLALFLDYAGMGRPNDRSQVPTYVLIPAFALSELKTAFQIGFVLYVPFLVVDMIVASTLMSMGMLMVPPTIVSLPFKVLLFVLVDGWNLVVRSLLASF